MLKITLDTSCFNKEEIEQNNGLIFELIKLQDGGFIKLYRDIFTDIESENLKGKRGKKVRQFIQENTSHHCHNCDISINSTEEEKHKQVEKNRGYSSQEFCEVHQKVDSILRKYCSENNLSDLNDYIDVRLLGQHILEKNDIFLTRNSQDYIKTGKRDIKAELKEKIPELIIRELNKEFLQELKSLLEINS